MTTYFSHSQNISLGLIAGVFLLLQSCASTTVSEELDSAAEPVQQEQVAADDSTDVDGTAADIVENHNDAATTGASVGEVDEVEEVTPPDTPAPAIRRATGDVVWIQKRLKDLGYYAGPVDGSVGEATRNAIKDYEADQGLTATGNPTRELQEFMWRNDD